MKPYLLILSFLLLLAGCSSESKTTDTRSNALPDLSARKQFLANYFKLPGKVEDLAFHVVYHDNSGGMVPGPSDYDIMIVAKIDTNDLALWKGTLKPSPDESQLDWVHSLIDWELGETVEVFGGSSNQLVFYGESGVIARRLQTMPSQ